MPADLSRGPPSPHPSPQGEREPPFTSPSPSEGEGRDEGGEPPTPLDPATLGGSGRARTLTEDPAAPIVILVRPQLADNIGACARAMANGGLTALRLVAPRDGWPQEKAWRTASGADQILNACTIHETVEHATEDCHRVLATCPRPRFAVAVTLTARGAAAELRSAASAGLRTGILFGPERAGLDREDLARADALVRYPLNPEFMSLNLAQAVMVMAYEWWTAADQTPARELVTHDSPVAPRRELDRMIAHLVSELDASGFLKNPDKRDGMVRNLRHLFVRAQATAQELQTFRGIIHDLAEGRMVRGKPTSPIPLRERPGEGGAPTAVQPDPEPRP